MQQLDHVYLPGTTIGILGGGQLGRMMALAGRAMGYRFYTLDPTIACPCAQVADRHIVAHFNDGKGATKLVQNCQVITYEFENVNLGIVQQIEKVGDLPQGSILLKITRNRIHEKQMLQSFDLPVAPYQIIERVPFEVAKSGSEEGEQIVPERPATLEALLREKCAQLGLPVVMKTATGGYDGKGQWVIRTEADLEQACNAFSMPEYEQLNFIVEKFVPFEREISVVVARNRRGEVATFPVAENVHVNNILHMSIVPARISQESQQQAEQIARQLASKLNLVGVLAIEMFYNPDGTIYINELAPRPHNSGHYTMDACETSQFEQHIRAICNLPLGGTKLLTPVVMVNLLGQHVEEFMKQLAHLPNNIKFHWYGKKSAANNRKMGHINVLADDIESALQAIEKLTFFNEM